MTLTAKDVAEITRLLEESSFDELYLELDGLKLSLKRGAAVHAHGGGDSVGSLAGAPIPEGGEDELDSELFHGVGEATGAHMQALVDIAHDLDLRLMDMLDPR